MGIVPHLANTIHGKVQSSTLLDGILEEDLDITFRNVKSKRHLSIVEKVTTELINSNNLSGIITIGLFSSNTADENIKSLTALLYDDIMNIQTKTQEKEAEQDFFQEYFSNSFDE